MGDWYTPPHFTQRTGTKCQFSNCWATVGAWLHNAATGGTAKLTPEEFRAQAGGGSGRETIPGCNAGNETDMIKGLDKLGVKANLLKVTASQARDILSQERRAVFGIAVDYDAWPADKDCMNGTAGPDVNHMVGIIGGPTLKVMNPLCSDYQTVKIADVLAAANKLAVQTGRDAIYLARVVRPIPATVTDDKKRIAELEAQVADRDDAIAEALKLNEQITTLLVPFMKRGA